MSETTTAMADLLAGGLNDSEKNEESAEAKAEKKAKRTGKRTGEGTGKGTSPAEKRTASLLTEAGAVLVEAIRKAPGLIETVDKVLPDKTLEEATEEATKAVTVADNAVTSILENNPGDDDALLEAINARKTARAVELEKKTALEARQKASGDDSAGQSAWQAYQDLCAVYKTLGAFLKAYSKTDYAVRRAKYEKEAKAKAKTEEAPKEAE